MNQLPLNTPVLSSGSVEKYLQTQELGEAVGTDCDEGQMEMFHVEHRQNWSYNAAALGFAGLPFHVEHFV
jgi:hypothetical protein